MPGLTFDRAKMRRSRWRKINLTNSSFQEADLESATITGLTVGVDLYKANCQGATFDGLTFEDSCLVKADFRRAQIFGQDFSGALISFIDLKGTNLALAKGLADAKYAPLPPEHSHLLRRADAPALLDETTVGETLRWFQQIATVRTDNAEAYESFRSIVAPIDETADFFQRNGVDPVWVRTFRQEAAHASESPASSVFISYSFEDTEFAHALNDRLRKGGIATWIASLDIEGGSTIIEQIRSNISKHDRVLLIVSPKSIESRWVTTEVREAVRLEIETGKKIIYPIRLAGMKQISEWRLFDADLGIAVAQRVREFFIPDFSEWRNAQKLDAMAQALILTLCKTENRTSQTT